MIFKGPFQPKPSYDSIILQSMHQVTGYVADEVGSISYCLVTCVHTVSN